MSLHPIQFGADVVEQYGRFQLTSFPVADPELAAQFRDGLEFSPGRAERLAKGPYIYLNRPFVQGTGIGDLTGQLGLHPALGNIFPFETLYKHQEESLRAVLSGHHVMLATGTGSGKTEGFLLPIVDHCLKLRDANAEDGVAAVLIYPMNALVNDQMDRLRPLLAGSRITFGRYTGETPEKMERASRIEQSRRYSAAELKRWKQTGDLPAPWEECLSREEINRRKPRLLLTNYAQLEYMLLRDKDLDLFRGAPLRFFVLDEVHTYTGSVGAEVACLMRRLRAVTGKRHDEVVCIGTSATVTDREGGADGDRRTVVFGARLFGVSQSGVELIREKYQPIARSSKKDRYIPEVPKSPRELLHSILDAVRETILAEEADEVTEEALHLAERLCGHPVSPGPRSLERLHTLLAPNRMVEVLHEAFTRPVTMEEVLPRIRAVGGRGDADPADLQAEVLAYLTLGTLARKDDEPLFRPKLHYFVQGIHGLWLTWLEGGRGRRLAFGEPQDDRYFAAPLLLCRSCGQHYWYVSAEQPQAVSAGGVVSGVRAVRALSGPRETPASGELGLYVTDKLVTDEGEEAETAGERLYLCAHCGALHEREGDACLSGKCRRAGALVAVEAFEAPPKSCKACGSRSSERSPVITAVRSQEVYDVMILAQTMLACMQEPDLRKVLIFADSRQQAAFQAGWMANRSLRFRVRHMAYRALAEAPERFFYFKDLNNRVADIATMEGVVPEQGAKRQPLLQKIEWILVEEFFAASQRQRRNSLEQLGLAQLDYEGIDEKGLGRFGAQWAAQLAVTPGELADFVHLVLDTFRLKHAVSHEMLRRWWNQRDREVWDGIINVPEYYAPQLIVLESGDGGRTGRITVPFKSARGATTVERLVAKAIPELGANRELRTVFIDALWDWLVERRILFPTRIYQKRGGQILPLEGTDNGHHVNLEFVRIGYAESRYVCGRCRIARARKTPSGICPGHLCEGTLQQAARDAENYDVVQYTRYEFVPLNAREHSAQVPQVDRIEAERLFKKQRSSLNCLVATPTLELGVDIGQLEMVIMRNVPPTPSNYAQRAGRAGRRHRIGAVFSYCRPNQHDQYFYADPPAMIQGDVRIPAFSTRNEPLIRKHVHSAILTAIRGIDDPAKEDVLKRAFPSYIWSYFGEKEENGVSRLRLEPPDLRDFAALIITHEDEILRALEAAFTEQWPEEEQDVVAPERLRQFMREMPGQLGEVIGKLVAEMRAYHAILEELRRRQSQGVILPPEENKRRTNFEAAQRRRWSETQDNYSLSYLARNGFFPGYALVKDNVKALCTDPPLDVSRPLAVALRELTPANRIYANGNQFKVRRLDFYKLKAYNSDFTPSQLEVSMVLSADQERVLPLPERPMEGGDKPGVEFSSLSLIDAELDGLGNISDQDEYPYRVAFNHFALHLPEHRGGHTGEVGSTPYRFLRNGRLRLVNIGPRRKGPASPQQGSDLLHIGYPICPVCGETRSPFASIDEIANFRERHKERCSMEPKWYALHADIVSDLLLLGPFEEEHNAVNAIEAIRIGASQVLEMGEMELESGIVKNDVGDLAVLYDPTPGGSGFLPLVLEHWSRILEAARASLDACGCGGACYKCLLSFRNQQHHTVLDKHRALNALGECWGDIVKSHEIPPNYTAPSSAGGDAQDSPRELTLLDLLLREGFPEPLAQFPLDLGGGTTTLADFAYPEQRVLIYVDGLSSAIHGNPEQKRRDMLIRARARVAGWQVCVISAEGVHDKTIRQGFLEELGVYLDKS